MRTGHYLLAVNAFKQAGDPVRAAVVGALGWQQTDGGSKALLWVLPLHTFPFMFVHLTCAESYCVCLMPMRAGLCQGQTR